MVDDAPGAALFRRVLGRFTTGVTAVTATAPDGRPIGLTVNSFTSVSLNPPLVSFCIDRLSRSWPDVRATGRLCVNILGRDQRALCAQFSSGDAARRFHGVEWFPAPDGSPVLAESIAWLNGAVHAEHAAGDHVIVVVRVDRLEERGDRPPLVLFGGRFVEFQA